MAVNPAATSAAPQITGAIRQAAQSTGTSFEYLLTTAKIESNFNPSAQASTSSAKGLYQFIDQTWLGTMKQDGAALGLGRYADARPGHRMGATLFRILECGLRSCSCAVIQKPARCWLER
jgi:Transglycosylase SLT domain